MTVYDQLRERLAPIGIYAENAPVLEQELQVYADELSLLHQELEVMLGERFITTARDRGLTVYEELFGPERADCDVEERRKMLQLRLNLGEGDFTPAGFRRALDSLGLNYVINEFPELNRLNIAATADYTVAQQALISREVSRLVPAHLEFQLTFNTLTWQDYDGMDRTFGEVDNEDLTWKQADMRTA